MASERTCAVESLVERVREYQRNSRDGRPGRGSPETDGSGGELTARLGSFREEISRQLLAKSTAPAELAAAGSSKLGASTVEVDNKSTDYLAWPCDVIEKLNEASDGEGRGDGAAGSEGSGPGELATARLEAEVGGGGERDSFESRGKFFQEKPRAAPATDDEDDEGGGGDDDDGKKVAPGRATTTPARTTTRSIEARNGFAPYRGRAQNDDRLALEEIDKLFGGQGSGAGELHWLGASCLNSCWLPANDGRRQGPCEDRPDELAPIGQLLSAALAACGRPKSDWPNELAVVVLSQQQIGRLLADRPPPPPAETEQTNEPRRLIQSVAAGDVGSSGLSGCRSGSGCGRGGSSGNDKKSVDTKGSGAGSGLKCAGSLCNGLRAGASLDDGQASGSCVTTCELRSQGGQPSDRFISVRGEQDGQKLIGQQAASQLSGPEGLSAGDDVGPILAARGALSLDWAPDPGYGAVTYEATNNDVSREGTVASRPEAGEGSIDRCAAGGPAGAPLGADAVLVGESNDRKLNSRHELASQDPAAGAENSSRRPQGQRDIGGAGEAAAEVAGGSGGGNNNSSGNNNTNNNNDDESSGPRPEFSAGRPMGQGQFVAGGQGQPEVAWPRQADNWPADLARANVRQIGAADVDLDGAGGSRPLKWRVGDKAAPALATSGAPRSRTSYKSMRQAAGEQLAGPTGAGDDGQQQSGRSPDCEPSDEGPGVGPGALEAPAVNSSSWRLVGLGGPSGEPDPAEADVGRDGFCAAVAAGGLAPTMSPVSGSRGGEAIEGEDNDNLFERSSRGPELGPASAGPQGVEVAQRLLSAASSSSSLTPNNNNTGAGRHQLGPNRSRDGAGGINAAEGPPPPEPASGPARRPPRSAPDLGRAGEMAAAGFEAPLNPAGSSLIDSRRPGAADRDGAPFPSPSPCPSPSQSPAPTRSQSGAQSGAGTTTGTTGGWLSERPPDEEPAGCGIGRREEEEAPGVILGRLDKLAGSAGSVGEDGEAQMGRHFSLNSRAHQIANSRPGQVKSSPPVGALSSRPPSDEAGAGVWSPRDKEASSSLDKQSICSHEPIAGRPTSSASGQSELTSAIGKQHPQRPDAGPSAGSGPADGRRQGRPAPIDCDDEWTPRSPFIRSAAGGDSHPEPKSLPSSSSPPPACSPAATNLNLAEGPQSGMPLGSAASFGAAEPGTGGGEADSVADSADRQRQTAAAKRPHPVQADHNLVPRRPLGDEEERQEEEEEEKGETNEDAQVADRSLRVAVSRRQSQWQARQVAVEEPAGQTAAASQSSAKRLRSILKRFGNERPPAGSGRPAPVAAGGRRSSGQLAAGSQWSQWSGLGGERSGRFDKPTSFEEGSPGARRRSSVVRFSEVVQRLELLPAADWDDEADALPAPVGRDDELRGDLGAVAATTTGTTCLAHDE